MNLSTLTGLFIIFGSFIIGYIIAPIFLIFSITYAIMVYIISWLMLGIGLIICGKDLYNVSIDKIEKLIKYNNKR